MESLAPIVLFVYNRLQHTKQTVEALKANKLAESSDLFIYSDGPKNDKDKEKVDSVRDYINKVDGFNNVTVIIRERNMGLAASVISGVTEIINKYGKIIVLEDDLITAPCFLEYMNLALEKYKSEKKVFSVTGYSFFENGNKKLPQTYFSYIFCSWTWGTWKDRWDMFEENPTDWVELKTNRAESKLFDYDGCYDYTEMMIAQMEKKTIDSWAIRWYYTCFKHKGLTLYVNKSMCENKGFDGSGMHCGKDESRTSYSLETQVIKEFPKEITELSVTRRLMKKSISNRSFSTCIKRYLQVLKRWGKQQKI